jgi:predicted DNA-binding protein (UPF0251 family)
LGYVSEIPFPRPRQPLPEEDVVPAEEIYVIGSSWNSLVTIGAAPKAAPRLQEIQAQSPVPLLLLWSGLGNQAVVRHLHAELGDSRRHGDWFDLTRFANPLEAVTRLAEEGDQARQLAAFAHSTEALGAYRQTLLAEVAQVETAMKPEVVDLVRSGRMSRRAAARRYGLSRETVRAWVTAAAKKDADMLRVTRLATVKSLSSNR